MSRQSSYWTIWIAALLFFAAFYALMIPLPLYLTGVGLPDWQVSIVLGALGVTSLGVRPLAGIFADGWGRRPVMLLGSGALFLGAVGVSMTPHPGLLFGLRVLQATGYVAFTTAATAFISDLAVPEKRGSALALFGVAANVAMTLTPAGINAGLETITLTGAFWLAGGLALLGGLMAVAVPQNRSVAPQPLGRQDLLTIAKKLAGPITAAALFGVGFGAFFQFLPLLTERRAFGSAGLIYTLYGISIILTRLLTGRLLDRGRHGLILSASFLALGAGLAGFAFAAAPAHLVGAVILFAIGSGTLHPLLIAIHISWVAPQERGRASALFYIGFDLGIGLGAWILSPAFEWFGLTGLFLLAAVASFIGMWPAWSIAATRPETASLTAVKAK